MKPQFVLSLTLSLLCLGTGAALAQEDPCGDETGAAYGLCSAYVSMGCNTDNPDASETACSKVAANFMKITGRDISSTFLTCPCSVPGFDTLFVEVLAGQVPITSCSTSEFFFTDGLFVNLNFGATAYSGTTDGVSWRCGFMPNPDIFITAAEGKVCMDLLEQAANNQGVTCQ